MIPERMDGQPDRMIEPGPRPLAALLSKDEIKRRLVVYAYTIDGYDSLSAGMQVVFDNIAEWVERELQAARAASGEPSMVDDETCERCCHGTGRHTCQRAMRIEPSEAMIEALHAVLDSDTCGCNKGQYIMRGLRERVRAALAAGSSK